MRMRPPRTSDVCIDSQIFLSSNSNSSTNILAASSLLSAQPPTARQQASVSIRCAYAAHTLRSIPAPPPSSLRSLPQHVSKDTSAYVSIRYGHCSHTLRSIPVPPPSLSAQPPTGMPPPHTSAYVSSIRIYVSIRCAAYAAQHTSLLSAQPPREAYPPASTAAVYTICVLILHIYSMPPIEAYPPASL
jgi:hypothetical protein